MAEEFDPNQQPPLDPTSSAAVPREAIFEEEDEDDTDEDYDDTEPERASVGTEDGMTEEETTDDDETLFSVETDEETDEESPDFTDPSDPRANAEIMRVFGFNPRNQPPRGSGISRFGRFSGLNQVFDR